LSPYGGWQAEHMVKKMIPSNGNDLVGYGSPLDRVLPSLALVVGELSQCFPDFSILGLIVLFVYTVGGSFLPDGVSQDDQFSIFSTMRLLEAIHIIQAFGMHLSLVKAIHQAISVCLLEDDAVHQHSFYFCFYDTAFIELFAQVCEHDFMFDEEEEEEEEMNEQEEKDVFRQRHEAMHKLANAQQCLNAKLNLGLFSFCLDSHNTESFGTSCVYHCHVVERQEPFAAFLKDQINVLIFHLAVWFYFRNDFGNGLRFENGLGNGLGLIFHWLFESISEMISETVCVSETVWETV